MMRGENFDEDVIIICIAAPLHSILTMVLS
jgi:hypothetical protein